MVKKEETFYDEQKTGMASNLTFLAGGGEMGERIRSKDWSSTSLGPVENWPQNLRTVVRIMLTLRQPIWIAWGPELLNLYNDPYRAIVGGKHPDALGQPISVVWREIWSVIGPRIDIVLRDNVGTYDESALLIMERNGYPEETYYTFSYSPIPGDHDEVGGIICANTEDTQRIISERQLRLLSKLAGLTADVRTVEDACQLSMQSLSHDTYDIPFALLYFLDPETKRFSLAGNAGINGDHPAIPLLIDAADTTRWPFLDVIDQHQWQLLPAFDTHFANLPSGAWHIPPTQAVVLPIVSPVQTGQSGVLVVGLNPHRLFDTGYQDFLNLVASQISSSIASAYAYVEERKRAEALAEIDRAKTMFFSNVSHEFRTPLTLMLGPLEDALNDQRTTPLNSERMDIAYRNALRLLKLVNSLLDFSRLEAGRIQASYAPTDISVYTADLASNFRSAIEKAGMTLRIHTPQLSEPVYLDRDMWEKIVLNLLSNAFKFTFTGEIEVSLRERKKHVVLTVRDTGTGIAPEHLPHIFERFHRVEAAPSRSFEGSGIGLALVQELVKLHKGTIEVASSEGEGTTFTVTIPKGSAHLPTEHIGAERTRQSTALGASPYVEEAMHWLPDHTSFSPEMMQERHSLIEPPVLFTDRPRIVLADDNADMREYVTRLLSDWFAVEAVANGSQALAAVRRARPDLVLSDVMMPEMDGFQLLKMLKTQPDTSRIPVILLSARAGEDATIEGVRAGADDYLIKPFAARELLARVTTHIKTNRSRYETEQRLYDLFMQAPGVIVILQGPEYIVELANPNTLQVLGRKPEDVLHKPLFTALPEISGQGLETLLSNVYTTGEPYVGHELPVAVDQSGDGNLRDFYFTFVYTPLRNAHNTIEGIMVFAYDVTGQVLARRQVEESEERFRTLADNIPNLAWMARPDGTVYWYNSRWSTYTGKTSDQLQQEGWQALLEPQTRQRVEREWQHSLAQSTPLDMVLSLCGADGAYHPFLTRVVPIYDPDGGHIVQWFGTSTDITRQKELEQQKDDFIAIASHELKTPVTSIKAYTQLLALRFKKAQDERSVELVRKMEGQLNKLTGLISDLLDVSKIESGKIQFRETLFPFHELIREVIEETQRTTRTHQIRAHYSQLPALCGDRDRIGQVLTNLITNALKYSPQASAIDVRAVREDRRIVVSVQDYGVGIPVQEQSRVFERFFRVEGETRVTYPGLGLGLYISAEIVKRHGGQIWVESKDGAGSTFSFALPLPSEHKTGSDKSH